MKQSNTKMGQVEWRRNKVQELSVKGFNQADISRLLKIPKSTISRDIEYLRQQASETIRNHL
jgi:DNA-directed RNA polymerase specialized sigma24 family protein